MNSKKNIGFFCGCLLISAVSQASETIDLRQFEEKLSQANGLENIVPGSPEAMLLESLNTIADAVVGKSLGPQEISDALTLLDSTDIIEEMLPKEAAISFGNDFLAGSDLSMSDLTNASYFLNSLNAKKLANAKNIEALSLSSRGALANVQSQVINLSKTNVGEMISQLEKAPEIDLVQLSSAIDGAGAQITSNVAQAEAAISQSAGELQTASNQISSATQTLSFAAGAAMAAAAYSLDQAASAIANSISAGVAVDLEAASQGMGFDSFADAVNAYNQQYGTNYTVDSARQALGQ